MSTQLVKTIVFISIGGLLSWFLLTQPTSEPTVSNPPGSIDRRTAGFGDRDAWCWMLGVLAVTGYLYKEQMVPGYRRWIATALAGFTCFIGGMS
ncbi:hypothetical protein F4054_04765 [Candidatus Poribacteria bacterium]|nr:hypothetical protein [Candidatus Poribacteria bacterium]MYG07352.1 hypothetical protein [Candidatus Poribacteria bacterium]MYK21555.1 hypothetical protein [Candidatus Poribacteria bacterium]